jgi:rod shape-determining protein MreD
MKYLFLAVSAFLAVAVQMIASDIFFPFSLLNISLLLVVWCAIYRSRVLALLLGSFTGLLLDAALGWPLGYNGFGLTLAVFVIGQSWDRLNTAEQPVVRFLILTAASLTNSMSMFLLFWIMQRTTSRVFIGSAVLQALITAGAGLIFFVVLECYKRTHARNAH